MSATAHLKKRGNVYFVRFVVPADLRVANGPSEVVRTLKTADLRVAQQRRWTVIAEILRGLKRQPLKGAHLRLDQEALQLRSEVQAASDEDREIHVEGREAPEWYPSRKRELRDHAMERAADIADQIDDQSGIRFKNIATGVGLPLSLAAKDWLEDRKGRVTNQTLSHNEYATRLLQESLPEALVEGIGRREAAAFTKALTVDHGKHVKTARRIVSNLRAWWAWLSLEGLTTNVENPWDAARVKAVDPKASSRSPKRAYTKDELLKILAMSTAATAMRQP